MAVICVGVTFVTNASFVACPLPGSNTTRTGMRKFDPVMMTCWFPVGSPETGLMLLIVGAFEGGVTGMIGSVNVSVMLFVTLLTVTFTMTGPAVLAVTVALATPAVVVLINVVG